MPVGAQAPAIVPLLFVGIDLGVFSKAMMEWQPGMSTEEWERSMDGAVGGSAAGRSDEK